MRYGYFIKRFGIFVLIVWLASSVNFFLPRFGGQDPMRAHLLEQAMLGGYVQAGLEEMVVEYNVKFGLDKPLWQQYLNYLGDVVRLDFNYSVSNYPRTVTSMLADALPWTIGLLLTTTLLAFTIGTMLGAILGWPGAPRWLRFAFPPLMALNPVPFCVLRGVGACGVAGAPRAPPVPRWRALGRGGCVGRALRVGGGGAGACAAGGPGGWACPGAHKGRGGAGRQPAPVQGKGGASPPA